jgi:sensor domain DACNV-containing protein
LLTRGQGAKEYPIHIYPRELARTIASQWNSDEPVQLPAEDELAAFLSEAYQASLLREEDRAVSCRLILIDPTELSDDTGPPEGFQVLHLVEERRFREHEIRRLSPSATFYRSLIAVWWNPRKGFFIWGVINSGSRWINETDGGRLRGPDVPDRLIVHIRGPGNLIILRGARRIATLLTGKLQGHGFRIFEASWLVRRQEQFARWASRECFKDQVAPALVNVDFTRALSENVTKRIITHVQRTRHGGMFIITMPGAEKLVSPTGPIRPKYLIRDTKATQRYRDLMFSVMRTLSVVAAERGFKSVGWKDYQEFKDDRLAELDEAIFEYARFLADLMAVDGALVLTAARDLIGFGAEIHVPTVEKEVVYRALDIEGQEFVEERADDAGTRHRSAYRLARVHPECMITVVSQDGSIRYVGNPSGNVIYWDVLSF